MQNKKNIKIEHYFDLYWMTMLDNSLMNYVLRLSNSVVSRVDQYKYLHLVKANNLYHSVLWISHC